MIMGKFWAAFRAQVNKLANFFWTADPIAQMQYEYDQSVAQLSEGRKGLEQYRALVERVTYQVNNEQRHITDLESKVKAYLQAGDRETASKFALELQKAKSELAESFNFDVTTDFGQIEQVIQDKIGLNRAKVRVAADLSSEGIVDVQRELAAEKVLADQALKQFEVDMGLVTPETAGVKDEAKELGAAKQRQTT